MFADLNGDGVRDGNEPGQPGVLVGVDLLGDGTVEFNTTTRADGSFEVANVPDGNAKVTVTPPANYRNSGAATSSVTVSAATPASPLTLGVRPTTAPA